MFAVRIVFILAASDKGKIGRYIDLVLDGPCSSFSATRCWSAARRVDNALVISIKY